MPLDLAESMPVGDDSTVCIDVKLPAYDSTIKVWFDPTRYNWQIEKTLSEAKAIPAQAIKDFVVTFVTDWELDYNKERIPPTEEGLRKYNVHFLNVLTPVANAVLEKLTEGKAQSNALPTRSPTVNQQRKK